MSAVSQVVQVLRAAASGDASLRVPAHQQLNEIEGRPGFALLLLEAYSCSATDPQGRYLAILMCKNVVDRHWQVRVGQNSMDEKEKNEVRMLILKSLKLAATGGLPYLLELCLVLRKVCRLDFPRNWDDLARFILAELQQVQQHGFMEHTIGSIIIAHNVLKEQSTKKLISAKKDFHQIGQLLMEPLAQVWWMKFDQMRQHLESQVSNNSMWKLSRHLDGCFMILLAQGFAHLHETPRGADLICFVKDNVTLLLSVLQRHPNVATQCPYYSKNLKSVLKWWAVLLQMHPLAFTKANIAEVLHTSVEILQSCHSGVLRNLDGQALEGIARSSLQCLTHALNSNTFRKGPQPSHQGAALEAAATCHKQFAEFIQHHNVGTLCDLCRHVSLAVPLDEVQSWLTDPEDQLQGPGSLTDMHMAGEQFVKALGQPPLDQPLVEHIAKCMNEETQQALTPSDPYETVVRKDTFLVLLGLCQTQLKPHLQFNVMLSFFAPIAALVPSLNDKAYAVLLVVRMCWVLKLWANDMPSDAVAHVLQLLGAFIREGSPKAIRMATLGPLRAMLDRFSDHDAWTHLQSSFIDACLALMSVLTSPESQWRCLNIVHLFLKEEAESGRYEVTSRSLQQLLVLWKNPEESELLIAHALLDVFRALVLMSCHSRQPRLALSEPLLSACLVIISDCFAHHKDAAISPTAGAEARAALEMDAASAVGHLGNRGGASATLFDSGSLLFVAVLRTVDISQSRHLLPLFPQLLDHFGREAESMAKGASLHEHALDILFEYCVLLIQLAPDGSQLQPHFEALGRLSMHCLEKQPGDRTSEQCIHLLQLLVAYCPSHAGNVLCQLGEFSKPLLRLWASTSDWKQMQYPLQAILPLLCTWQANHPQYFVQLVQANTPGVAQVASLLVASCRVVRPIALRASTLLSALAMVENCGGSDPAFWSPFWQCCFEIIQTAQKKGTTAALSGILQSLKASLAIKLPVPARSSSLMQCAMLPADVRPSRTDDGMLDDGAIARAFFEAAARSLQRLSASQVAAVQSLLAQAPALVQEAFKASAS